MDHTSPIDDDGSVVSDHTHSTQVEAETCYVVRMTPLEKYSMEDLIKFIDEQMDNSSWIIAEELSKKDKTHYHLVLENFCTLEHMKLSLRTFLDGYWPPGERKRGFGNKQYNVQVAEDKEKAISYALKEQKGKEISLRKYTYKGYSQEAIDYYIDNSYTKADKATFKVEYQALCDRFRSDFTMTTREFATEFIRLKAKHGQQVRRQDVIGYTLSNEVARNPDTAAELAENFISDIY